MLTKRRINQIRLNNLKQVTEKSSDDDSQSRHLEELLKAVSSGTTLNEKLASAGYLSTQEQAKVIRFRNIISFGLGLVVFLGMFFSGATISKSLIFFVVALYFYFIAYFVWLRFKISKTEREVYYDTPLFLEELVLLVESGLALFSALQQICINQQDLRKKSVVRRYMSDAYQMASSGLQVSEAFEFVARNCQFKPIKNVLLHLDVSSSVGGELVNALQSLANQVHQEWKMSVETRVKKLENLVVFPVFAGVIGMMLLTAAVPLVPILDFMSSIKKVSDEARPVSASTSQNLNN